MADTEDLTSLKVRIESLKDLSTPGGNTGVNGVKVGETLTGDADGNAELRPSQISNFDLKFEMCKV